MLAVLHPLSQDKVVLPFAPEEAVALGAALDAAHREQESHEPAL